MVSTDPLQELPNQTFELEPIGKRVAYNILGLYVIFVLWVLWRAVTEDSNLISQVAIAFVLLTGLFALYIANGYAARIKIDSDAIERIGVSKHLSQRLPWQEMKRIQLTAGSEFRGMPASHRIFVVGKPTFLHSNRFEIFSTHTFYFNRKGFWPTAHLIVRMADLHNVEVKGKRETFFSQEKEE